MNHQPHLNLTVLGFTAVIPVTRSPQRLTMVSWVKLVATTSFSVASAKRLALQGWAEIDSSVDFLTMNVDDYSYKYGSTVLRKMNHQHQASKLN